ncbi:unnamed protein product [Cuscuta campestris]|uniref:Retrotransposon gag domain-containing protein n=1 Tax=Cuscuta campestris TaxID=132261 RepID=A0A484LD83_9ASTE|nr:unnamed protein product [Cuscuta campestris]
MTTPLPDPNSAAALAAAMEKRLSEMFQEFSEIQKGAIHQEIVSVHKKIGSLSNRVDRVEGNHPNLEETSYKHHEKSGTYGDGSNTPRYPRFKMDPPVTDGSDPHTWLFKATEFFEFNAIPEEGRLKVTGLMLDGAAVEWFRRMKRNDLINTWADFEEQFKFRFDPEMYEDYFGLLAKLQQTTTLMAYQTEFERLMNKVEGVTEATLISVFISGLKDPVRRELRVNRPSTLNGAFALARETAAKYEELQAPTRKNWAPTYPKPTSNPTPAPTKTITPYIPPNKEPILVTPRGIPAKPVRRISPAEKAEKDARGECYFCPQKWSRGHRCNGRYYLLVTNEDDEEGTEITEEHEALFEGDVSVLQSLAGSTTPRSIRLKAEIKGQIVDVLVDGGSTHNFIHPKTAERLQLALVNIEAFRVYVGNGDSLTCQAQCPQVPLLIQNNNFSVDLFVLAIHGHDVVLGTDPFGEKSTGKVRHRQRLIIWTPYFSWMFSQFSSSTIHLQLTLHSLFLHLDQDCLLRTIINKRKQERCITPKLIFMRAGQDDATPFENFLIEEQDVEA